MRIGFTGARQGMSNGQIAYFKYHLMNQGLEVFNYNEFHHGCCIGSDAEAHQLVLQISEMIPFQIHGHPSNMKKTTAELEGFTVKRAPKDPLQRNQDIVEAVDLLIACPIELKETKRSGTWATIRRAQAIHRPVIIIPRTANFPGDE